MNEESLLVVTYSDGMLFYRVTETIECGWLGLLDVVREGYYTNRGLDTKG